MMSAESENKVMDRQTRNRISWRKQICVVGAFLAMAAPMSDLRSAAL